MTSEIEKYRFIGAGHSQCFTGTLKDWFSNESFTNVVFFCKTGRPRQESRPLRANASVLAAASPIFRTLLRDWPSEEDAVIHLPDYSREVLSCVLQYVYVGSITLKATAAWTNEIWALLKELGLSNREEASSNNVGDSVLLRVRLRQKGQPSKAPNIIRRSVQVKIKSNGEAKQKAVPRVETVPLARNVNKTVLLKQYAPVAVLKKRAGPKYGDSIDCAVMDPDKVKLPLPLPELDDCSLGSVEKRAVVCESLKPTSSTNTGFSLSQCFARESRHTLLVKEYVEPLAPFEYDPSPLYLQKVPSKQYKRKRNGPESSRTTVPDKRRKLTSINKVHVSGAGESLPLAKDSIFADSDDFLATEGKTKVREVVNPKRSNLSNVESLGEKMQSNKEALSDLEKAKELLLRERKRRARLRIMARRIEERIELMKKRVSFRQEQMTARKSKRRKLDVILPCDICGKMIKEYWMKKHRKQHEAHEFCCDKCGRTFALRSRLNSHYQLQHVDISETGGFPCGVCGHVFKAKKYLTRHMTLHTGEKRYACRYCEKRFRTEKVRDNHQRTHTGEKPFVCHICQKPFSQKFNLSVHIKTHDKPRRWRGMPSDKPLPTFPCPHCPAKFRWETYLKTHMAKHTGESPVLPCELCDQVYTSFNQLRNHRKDAHPSKTILCDTCGKQFISKGCYYRHRRKHLKNKDSSKSGAGTGEQQQQDQQEQQCEVTVET